MENICSLDLHDCQKSWIGVAIFSKTEIRELCDNLPGEDVEYTRSRYIEAFIIGIVIDCIYLPNGNPYLEQKFDYKLSLLERFSAYAKDIHRSTANCR